jgi:hypothetical protein
MSTVEGDAAAGAMPAPEFAVLGAMPALHTATPGLVFTLEVTEPSGRDVYTIALNVRMTIDPSRRTYDGPTRERLLELFGPPERWRETIETAILFAQADVLVPSFSREGMFDVPVPLSYDLEVAAPKYVAALPSGHVPLVFTFTGTVFYAAEGGRMQIVKVPWSCTARFRLPVDVCRRSIEGHYGSSGWIRLHADTLERLQRLKAERALPSFDACLVELLEDVREKAG